MSAAERAAALVHAAWLEGWIRAAGVTTSGSQQALQRLDHIRRALETAR